MADYCKFKDGQTWLHHIIVIFVTDNIVSNDVVVPDFNVCTNTILYSLPLYSTTYPPKERYNVFDVNYFYTKNRNRYKPHKIVKDSHLKERQRWVPLT